MAEIPRHILARLVEEALIEDIGPGDITSEAVIPAGLAGRAEIRTRSAIVVAGAEAAAFAFLRVDPDSRVVSSAAEGERLAAGDLVMTIEGAVRSLLTSERTALNFLGRLSGIATLTRLYVDTAGRPACAIADTRKTTPGMRLLEKRAVELGGGRNHRFGLWDAILIKDNHVDAAGGIGEAVRRAREARGAGEPIEVEVRTLEEIDEALLAGADSLLLDNFTVTDLETAVSRARGRAFLEVSGGVTLETVSAVAALGVDRISIGALTHSAASADLTMRVTT